MAVFHACNDRLRSFCELPYLVQKPIIHQSRIHGMYYRNRESPDVEYAMTCVKHKLFSMLIDYQQKHPERCVLVAYKGDSVERQLLSELEFEGVNIELFGYLKFEELQKVYLDDSNSCKMCENYHSVKQGKEKHHCSKKEVLLFACFLYDFLSSKKRVVSFSC